MANSCSTASERALIDRERQFAPEELLHFVELEFIADWRELGLDVEQDLWVLQLTIMSGPKKAPVISGTGGLRKLRFAPPAWGRGKSSAIRVCYAFFEKHAIVLLVMAYAKGRKDTLTAKEKVGVREYLAEVEEWLDRRKIN